MAKSKLEKVIDILIDIPPLKLAYILCHKDMVKGLVGTFPRYGIEYTKEVHEALVCAVQDKLAGSPDVEYEWSENQYKNFVKFEGVENETQN